MTEHETPSCGCYAGLVVPGAVPKAAGRVRIDKAALRVALGGRGELIEAMEAKATGRIGANIGKLWAFLTRSLYQSGDLPVLSVREQLQNGRDAVAAAIKARKLRSGDGRFVVTWDPDARTLACEDNGIAMDAATILNKFLVIGETGKGGAEGSAEAAGGFGVAKAVILGASSTFRWELHTRDNLAMAEGADAEVRVFDAPYLAGTRLLLHDIAPEFDRWWDRARQAWVPIEDRIREMLAANDLPGLSLVFNGEEVKPMFSRRGGSRVSLDGSWGPGTSAVVKAYRRQPGDRQGSYFVRLDGLLQFRVPSQRGGLRADVVVDLSTTVRPGASGYPFNAARDALQDHARWAFSDLVDEVERENESVGRSDEDEVLDPESDDAGQRAGAAEIAELTAEVFADEDFRKTLAEAAGGIADFYGEMAKYAAKQTPTASLASPGTKADEDGDARRPMVLPPGMKVAAAATPVEPDIAAPSEVGPAIAARRLRTALEAADEVVRAGGGGGRLLVVTPEVETALERALSGEELEPDEVAVLVRAVERATDSALGVGGGGLLQAASLTGQASALLESVDPAAARRVRRNPFGKLAGLRISRKSYDRGRAYRFKKNYGRWIPFLTAWDATLRLVAAEARIRARFKPGFVLNDDLMGLAASSPGGGTVVYIHPDRFAQVVRAHRERPLAVAAFLHGVAVHELSHVDGGRMGEGHSEAFVAAREDLGAATAHLLPAVSVLVSKVLGLPAPTAEADRRAARLERDLEKARATAKEQKARAAALAREAETLRGKAATSQAERVLDAAAAALRARPPVGVDPAYIEGFMVRNRGALLRVVAGRLG